jgi:hypothetical protein
MRTEKIASQQEINEKACMDTDPFEGDFGDGERVLRDHMGTARKKGPCLMCGQQIEPGSRIRMRTETYNGQIQTFRWCSLCCAAMAASWEDEGKALEARINLHPNMVARNASLLKPT